MLAPRSQGLLDGDGFLVHQALHLGRETDGRNVKGGPCVWNKHGDFYGI